jgi:hypothetical protein
MVDTKERIEKKEFIGNLPQCPNKMQNILGKGERFTLPTPPPDDHDSIVIQFFSGRNAIASGSRFLNSNNLKGIVANLSGHGAA